MSEVGQRVLDHLAQYEQDYIESHSWFNPFRRPGVIVSDLAFACGLVKDETTTSGRVKVDAPAMRRVLKELAAAGKIECTGKHRTMSCGSVPKECWALAGFTGRVNAFITTNSQRQPDG